MRIKIKFRGLAAAGRDVYYSRRALLTVLKGRVVEERVAHVRVHEPVVERHGLDGAFEFLLAGAPAAAPPPETLPSAFTKTRARRRWRS